MSTGMAKFSLIDIGHAALSDNILREVNRSVKIFRDRPPLRYFVGSIKKYLI